MKEFGAAVSVLVRERIDRWVLAGWKREGRALIPSRDSGSSCYIPGEKKDFGLAVSVFVKGEIDH